MFEQQVLGGILGFAVGDALGVPVEFEPRGARKEDPVAGMRKDGTYGQPAGTWSDDTSMTLCALESLTRGLDYGDMMDRFLRWAEEGYWTPYGEVFDMGKTTREALLRYAKGVPALECGTRAERENGNGSLMRMLPAAFYLRHLRLTAPISREEMFAIVHDISGLTHAHPISLISCGIYCDIAHQLLDGDPPARAIASGVKHAKAVYAGLTGYSAWLPHFRRVELDTLCALPEDEIQSSGYVLSTLEAALWCLLHTDSLKDCLLTAVNLGSDTDTVAAVAGGLAGVYYGPQEIPAPWLDVLARRDEIEGLCRDFTRVYTCIPT